MHFLVYVQYDTMFLLWNIWSFLFICIECPNSGLSDPLIDGVTNCMSWAAFIEVNDGNFYIECSKNSSLAIKCCYTCMGKFKLKFESNNYRIY